MTRPFIRPLLLSSLLLTVPSLVLAQTAVGPVGTIPPIPVPKSVVQQAKEQANGNFANLKRSSLGGQIQNAWNNADKKAGVIVFEFCGLCTYKARLRQHMITLFEVPTGEIIERIDNGDPNVFTVNMRSKRRFAVQAVGYGVDTNLIVYGKSGNIYAFYVRVESFNSKNISDQVVKIVGGQISQEISIGATIGGKVEGLSANSEGLDASPSNLSEAKLPVDRLVPPPQNSGPNDFINKVPFNPDSLHGWGDYKIWGGGADMEGLRPETVFRDDQFTYIKFGNKWKDIELPTAYVVLDKIDELVNTRIQGHTFIVESTQNLITLKSGQSFLCIQYTGAS